MIVEDIMGKMMAIYAEGNNKITDKDRTFFSTAVFAPLGTDISNYEEVPRDVWKAFDEDKTTEFYILEDEIIKQKEINDIQDELILTSMDALAENYELSLTTQEENIIQDELILSSMDALAETYEQTLIMESTMETNEESILISMDALAELYEMILTLQTEIDILKGGATNGNGDGNDIL